MITGDFASSVQSYRVHLCYDLTLHKFLQFVMSEIVHINKRGLSENYITTTALLCLFCIKQLLFLSAVVSFA